MTYFMLISFYFKAIRLFRKDFFVQLLRVVIHYEFRSARIASIRGREKNLTTK